jgi:hypothetical protein
MSRRCKHCGMDSDTDKVCSWCGKDLEPVTPTPPTGAPPAQPGQPQTAPPPQAGQRPMSRRPVQPVKRGRPAWVYWVAAAVGLVVLAIAGCFVAAAVVSRPPAAPGDWQSVESKTKKMTLQVPANWKWSTSGSEGTFEWVTVKPGGLYVIRIKGSAVKGSIGDIGSAMQRMASGDGGGEDLGVEMRAEGALHELLGEVEKKQDRHYRGTSDMQPCTFGGKPAAYSEYSTTKRIGIATVRLKGARMSVPAGDLGYDVRIICPAAHWDTFQPHASKLLESVQLR